MKQVKLEINGSPVTVKVSKWTGRPKGNGIRIIATRDSLSLLKEALEAMYNIDINIYIDDYSGLYIPEEDATCLEEGTIILGLKEASKRGWLNSPTI